LVLTFVKVPTAIAYECQNRDTSGKPSRLAVPVPLHEPYASLTSALHPLQRRAPVWLFRSPHHCCRGFVMRTS